MGEMIKSFDGTNLYLNRELPDRPKAALVIVHGLCEHQGRYDYLAGKFHKAGIATYRFDHRGHGRSEGERTYFGDFNELLDDANVVVDMALRENPDIPVFLMGHSMGGFTVALYGVKYPDKKLKGIITTGALTHDNIGMMRAVPAGQDPHMKLPNALTAGGGLCSVAEVVEGYAKDPYNSRTFTTGLCYALRAGLEWFAQKETEFAYPVLMLHGEKDGLVSVKDTYEFFSHAASTDRQMKIYGNLFHEIFHEYCKDEVIGDMVAWVEKRI